MDVLFWGPFVRICQAAVACAPTLVIGWLIAAIFERILGREGTFRLFGGRSWRQLPYAWLLGMLLPVCSFGVIPIMVQMRRSGISGGTIIAFGLTAPLFNPISVLYGLTLSDPFTLFVFCLGSLSVITVIGVVWDSVFPNNWLEPETLPPTPYGLRRIAAVALSMADQAFSRSSYYIFIALLGVGLLAGLLPAGVLQHSAGSNDLTAPLTMCGIATLAYVTPMVAIVQVASMFQHGNSIGASFTLLVMGTGVNLGLLMWSVAVVLAFSYGVNGPLHPKGVQSADHTHAFDGYCNPFILNATNVSTSAIQTVRDSTKLEDVIAGIAALVLLTVGWIRHRFDPQQRMMGFLVRRAEGIAKVSKDIILPNSVIAAVTLVGLVLASIGACFLYYQPVNEIKTEMTALQADLFSSVAGREWDTAAFLIVQQEDWAHKLVVGQYLRRQSLNRFQKMRMKVFLSKLELLEHACEDRDAKEADHWNRQVNVSLNRFKKSLESK